MAGKHQHSSPKDVAKQNRVRDRTNTGAVEPLNHEQEHIQKLRNSLILKVLFLAVAGWVMFTQVFLITQVNGNAMFPALKDGDLVIAFRIQQEYAKNDVAVYTVDDKNHIGRIAAMETDVVTLDDSGNLFVNGTYQAGEILYPTYAKEGLNYPYAVPEEHIFFLGDYRTQTEDSRDFGSIPMENVRGKVITILRRRGL